MIEPTSGKNISNRISGLKCRNHPTVIDLCPAKIHIQHRLEDSQYGTVEIIDCRGTKQQGDDDPSDETVRDWR